MQSFFTKYFFNRSIGFYHNVHNMSTRSVQRPDKSLANCTSLPINWRKTALLFSRVRLFWQCGQMIFEIAIEFLPTNNFNGSFQKSKVITKLHVSWRKSALIFLRVRLISWCGQILFKVTTEFCQPNVFTR